MPKMAANLSMLFNEVPFMDRFDAAAKAGFKGVEFLFPYSFNLDDIAEKLQKNDLELVLHNLPAGNWEAGERGIACHPDRVGEFQDGVGTAINAAKKLGVKQVNCLSGPVLPGVSVDKLRATFVDNLKFAAEKLKAEGIRLVTEPVNTFDMKGAFLNHTQQAVDIIRDVGSDNLFIQYDIYHMQRMEGELAEYDQSQLAVDQTHAAGRQPEPS